MYPRDTLFSQNEPEEIIEKLDSLRLVIEFRGEYESEEPYIEEIHTMQREMSEAIEKLTRSEIKTIIDKLIKNVERESHNKPLQKCYAHIANHLKSNIKEIQNLDDYLTELGKVIDQIREIHRKAVVFGFCAKEAHFEPKVNRDEQGRSIIKPTFPKKRTGDERDHSHDRDQPPLKKRVDNITCNGCGRSGHKELTVN